MAEAFPLLPKKKPLVNPKKQHSGYFVLLVIHLAGKMTSSQFPSSAGLTWENLRCLTDSWARDWPWWTECQASPETAEKE